MTPRLPIVGMTLLLAATVPGCFTPSHGVLGYGIVVHAADSAPQETIVWEETVAEQRPPELPGLFDEADEVHAGNRSTSILLSKERHDAINSFCEAEWFRQTGQPTPENGSFPFSKGGRHYFVSFGGIIA